jgi:CRP-like cAMP-binding protein
MSELDSPQNEPAKEPVKFNAQELISRLVSATTIFKGFATSDVEALIAASKKVKLKAGEDIFLVGDKAREMFVLLSGEVIVWTDPPGRDQPLGTLSVGSHFGEMAIINSQSLRTTNVSASKDGLAISFSPLRLHDAPSAEPMIYRNVARQLADRLASIEKK